MSRQSKPTKMFNLQRFEKDGIPIEGKQRYTHKETHVWNKPYAICKSQKTKLEAIKWPPNTFFKIISL